MIHITIYFLYFVILLFSFDIFFYLKRSNLININNKWSFCYDPFEKLNKYPYSLKKLCNLSFIVTNKEILECYNNSKEIFKKKDNILKFKYQSFIQQYSTYTYNTTNKVKYSFIKV